MPEDSPPHTISKSADPLIDEALEWLVRIHSGRVSEGIQAECDAWRRRSLTHERAYRTAESIWEDIGHLPSRSSPPLPKGSHQRSDRTAWALAACIVLFTGLFFMESIGVWIRSATADYQTAVGEQRMVTLEDGSTIQLNTGTAVNVTFSDDNRDIRLLQGEAAFTVARDPDRPFTVRSDSLYAHALGTIFSVRLQENRNSVTVLEHAVQVETSESTTTSPLIIKEGQQVSFSNSHGLGEVHAVDMNREIAWRRGKLIFEARPLEEVVDELNRYRRGRIVILNPTLRPLRVTGVFDVADPDAALRTIHRTLSIHETALSPYLVLLH